MPHRDAAQRRAYYREWSKSDKKRRSNKFHSAARHANQRAVKHGIPGVITTADVRAILDGASCHYCGTTDAVIGLDHVVAMATGGPNTTENLVAACHSCNARKRQADRLGKWADHYEVCVVCSLTDRPHAGRGLCRRCYHRLYSRRKRA